MVYSYALCKQKITEADKMKPITITDMFEQTIIKIWSQSDYTSIISDLSFFSNDLKKAGHNDLASTCLFLIHLTHKKSDIAFLAAFKKLEQLNRDHPGLIQDCIKQEMIDKPELYESNLCNEQSQENVLSDKETDQDDQEIQKNCITCIIDDHPLGLKHPFCIECYEANDYHNYQSQHEKEQGREAQSNIEHSHGKPSQRTNPASLTFVGLTGSLSHLFKNVRFEHIEIKAVKPCQ